MEEKKLISGDEEEVLILENDDVCICKGMIDKQTLQHRFIYDKKRGQWFSAINGVAMTDVPGETYEEVLENYKKGDYVYITLLQYSNFLANLIMERINKEEANEENRKNEE